jgi:hypothetical protein
VWQITPSNELKPSILGIFQLLETMLVSAFISIENSVSLEDASIVD